MCSSVGCCNMKDKEEQIINCVHARNLISFAYRLKPAKCGFIEFVIKM